MAHTPHGNEPWRVDTYGGFDPDRDKDMNGKDYGRGDSVLIKIIYPAAVLIPSIAMMTIGLVMSVTTYFAGVLAACWIAYTPIAVASCVTVGSQSYSGMRRIRGIAIIAVGLVVFLLVSWWFMATHKVGV